MRKEDVHKFWYDNIAEMQNMLEVYVRISKSVMIADNEKSDAINKMLDSQYKCFRVNTRSYQACIV